MALNIVERAMTGSEFARMNAGFEEHALEHGVISIPENRHGFVLMDGEQFTGCVSGLLYLKWFYLTDLWLEKPFRKRGLGAQLLQRIEAKATLEGARHIWTWTAGYEAAPFYQKQGYAIFCQFEDYYPTGQSRVGLRKQL